MFCANCGQAIQGEPKFCPACGTPTAAVTDAENKPTASAPVKPKSRFPKWLPLVIGFVALLLIAKMCTPKHPNQSQMDEAAKIVLGQKDPAPSTESVSDVLRRSAETARASVLAKSMNTRHCMALNSSATNDYASISASTRQTPRWKPRTKSVA